MEVMPKIQILDLANNDLGHGTITALAPLLPSLISLNLSNCQIGNSGCTALANLLPNPSADDVIEG